MTTTEVASIAALRALTSATDTATAMGYYSVGDGGGGLFRWDTTETASADNGGTIIAPANGLSSLGRWKRVYDGEVNARWFGMHPWHSDNTAALQGAIDWVSTDTTRGAYTGAAGGVVFIPMGWYGFAFDAGTSGLSTITVSTDNVSIRGEGTGTYLMVNNHARPNQLAYFFTFDPSIRGQGGGIKDVRFYGNSMLKWCIYLDTWHNASFENISAFDVHSGILDAVVTSTGYYGENIEVRHLDLIASSGTTLSQYGVRFRAGSATNALSWSDCWISDCLFTGCWDTGVILDGLNRFTVRSIAAGNNITSTDTLDGTSKSGCRQTVRITNSIVNPATAATGHHVIDSLYLESLAGNETPTTNAAILIDTPAGQTGTNRYNRVSNVKTNTYGTSHCAFIRLVDTPGTARTHHNTLVGNQISIDNTDVVQIGPTVTDTVLDFTPDYTTINTPGATPSTPSDLYKQIKFTGLATAITSMTAKATSGRADGQPLDLLFKDNGTGRTIVWGALFTGTLLTTTIANKTHLQRFKWDAAIKKWAGYYADTAGY